MTSAPPDFGTDDPANADRPPLRATRFMDTSETAFVPRGYRTSCAQFRAGVDPPALRAGGTAEKHLALIPAPCGAGSSRAAGSAPA